MNYKTECRVCGRMECHESVEEQSNAADQKCPNCNSDQIRQLGPEKLAECFSL